MSINWKVRFNRKNILFLSQVLLSVLVPILTYSGMQLSDFTSWQIVRDTLIQAISNPYVIIMSLVSLFNAITDPTTQGISDSQQAQSYRTPKQS